MIPHFNPTHSVGDGREAFNIDEYLSNIRIRKIGETYIRQAFEEDTSRQVGQSGHLSTYVQFQSHKMWRSVPVESREGELAAALRLEADDDVYWYSSQPSGVSVQITMKNGVSRSQTVTADLISYGKTGVEVLEIKPRSKLDKLVRERPHDWKRNRKGYRYVPLEKAYKKLGIKYRIVVSEDMSKIETLNIKLLLQAIKSDLELPEYLIAAAQKVLTQTNYTSLDMLRQQLSLTNLDPLLLLIGQGYVLGALDKQRLVDSDSFLVTDGPVGLKAICSVIENRKLPNPMDSPLRLRGCRKALLQAVERLGVIATGHPKSSAYRLKKQLQQGIENGLSDLESMLPKHHLKGNREPKRVKVVLDTLSSYLADKKSSAYFDQYASLAEDAHPHEPPVDPTTFREYQNQQDQVELARDRGGNRSANLARSASGAEDRSLKASRAFETAVCDHYLVDLFAVLADVDGVKVTKQAWLSVLKDLHSGAVLSVWLDTRDPSRISVACLIRQCIRIHNRLPETVRTDRGPEFRSLYMAALAAHYGFNHELKPAGYPQSGGQIESYFETVRKQFLSPLPGNVVDMKSARSTSGSHSPRKKAKLPLGVLVEACLKYIDWFNRSTVNDSGAAPEFTLNESLRKITCSGIKAEYDGDAILATAVDVREFKLDRKRGLHINGQHYWNPAFKDTRIKKTHLDVRMEPESPDRVYAEINGEWVPCYCSNPENLAGLNESERTTQAILVANYSAIKKQVARAAGIKKHRDIFAKIVGGDFDTEIAPTEVFVEPVDPFSQIDLSTLPSITTTSWSAE